MSKTYKYRVCQMQMSRVTFVNGLWQGLQVHEGMDQSQLYNSCPMVWEYLDSAGRDGWVLTGAAQQAVTYGSELANTTSLLFLKKTLDE
ncbi:MAG TPA: hypothetical protein VF779_13770 [Pyrinomonadaceae bacterium]